MARKHTNIPFRDLRTLTISRAVRLPDFNYGAAAPIHVTICSEKPLIKNAAFARLLCESVQESCKRLGYQLFGYCLMPDHLHVLLSPAESQTPLATWLQRFKSFTGHEWARLGGTPPLWQRSAFDHICRKGEAAECVLRYIVENPEKAGLVNCWRDWAWLGAFIEI